MKKKILSFILLFCFLLTGMFALTACGNESSGNMSKSELATTFKSVAKQSWDKLGAGDPTIESSSRTVTSKNITLMSIDKSSIPNEMTEQTGDNAVNIKASAATMIAYVYMIGEYYENENFVASSKVVTFDMDNLILPNEKTTYSAKLSLLPKIDKSKNKVIVEMFLSSNTMYNNLFNEVKAYYYFDIDFNFQTNQMMGCYVLCVQNNKTIKNEDYEEYIEISLDKYGKCWGNEKTSDNFKAACNQTLTNFESEISQGEFLTGNFADEFNRYGDRANRAYSNVFESNNNN